MHFIILLKIYFGMAKTFLGKTAAQQTVANIKRPLFKKMCTILLLESSVEGKTLWWEM